MSGQFVMPFGKYRGIALDEIAKTDEGLLYLDWLRGERERNRADGAVDVALAAFLDAPAIEHEIEMAMEAKGKGDV